MTEYQTISKDIVRNLFVELRNRLNKLREANSKRFKNRTSIYISTELMREDILKKLEQLHHVIRTDEEWYELGIGQAVSRYNGKKEDGDGERKKYPVEEKALRRYLGCINNPIEVKITPGNIFNLNCVAIFLGYLGIDGYLSDPQSEIEYFISKKGGGQKQNSEGIRYDTANIGLGGKSNSYKKWSKRRTRVIIPFSLLLIIVITLIINHFYPLFHYKFNNTENGILILSLVGDREHSLQTHLANTLFEQVEPDLEIKIKIEQKIEIGDLDPVEGHNLARKIGKKYKASAVIWGSCAKAFNTVYPRITIVDNNLSRLYHSENLTICQHELIQQDLPAQLVSNPVVLLDVLSGYVYYKDDDYENAIAKYQEAMASEVQSQLNKDRLQWLVGFCHTLLISADDQNDLHFDAAIKIQTKIISQDPSIEAYTNRGTSYTAKRRFEKGEADYIQAIKINSQIPLLHKNLAILYFLSGELEKSLIGINQAIKLNPTEWKFYLMKGNIYSKNNNHESAIEFYKKALHRNRKQDGTYYQIGRSYAEVGKKAKAIKCLKKAIRINPKNVIALKTLGNILEDFNAKKALRYYYLTLELNSKDYEVFASIGNIYYLKEQYDSALVHYENACQLNPNLYQPWELSGDIYFDREEYIHAAECFLESLRIIESHSILYKIGLSYSKNKDYNKGKKFLSKASRVQKNDYQTWKDLAWVHYYTNNFDSTIICLTQADKINPIDFELWYGIGQDFAESIENSQYAHYCFTKALQRVEEKNIPSWIILGNIYMSLCRFKEGIECYTNAYNDDRNNDYVLINLSLCQIGDNKLKEAENNLNKAIRIEGEFLNLAYIRLGLVFVARNKEDVAISYFQKGLDITRKTINEYMWVVLKSQYVALEPYGITREEYLVILRKLEEISIFP